MLTTLMRAAGTPRLDEVVANGRRATLAESEVVFARAARVAVTFDRDCRRHPLLHPVGVLLQARPRLVRSDRTCRSRRTRRRAASARSARPVTSSRRARLRSAAGGCGCRRRRWRRRRWRRRRCVCDRRRRGGGGAGAAGGGFLPHAITNIASETAATREKNRKRRRDITLSSR